MNFPRFDFKGKEFQGITDDAMMVSRDLMIAALDELPLSKRLLISAYIAALAEHFLASGYIKTESAAQLQAEQVFAAIVKLPKRGKA